MRALSFWKTSSLFGNNIWIMGCTWLPNLSTYSLAVIRSWGVIMGPTECYITILLPKPSHNLPRVSLLEPGIPDCRFPWMFSKRHIWPYHARVSNCLMSRFYAVTPSFTHLSIAFSNQGFSCCSPTVDVGFVKLVLNSLCGNRVFKMNTYSVLLSPLLQ
jgi:hypothetical protein